MSTFKTWDELPKEIQDKMLERQYEQTGKMDATIFRNRINNNREHGGFDWGATFENSVMPGCWVLILKGDYEVFYKMFPSAKIKTFPREMLVWDDDEFNDDPPEVRTVIHDLGEEYEYRYLVEDGLWNDSTKKHHSMYRFAKEIAEESTRYFFLTYSVLRQNTTDTVSYTEKFNQFPTHKKCIEFGEEEAIKSGKFKSVFLLGMTELSREDYEVFKSETK